MNCLMSLFHYINYFVIKVRGLDSNIYIYIYIYKLHISYRVLRTIFLSLDIVSLAIGIISTLLWILDKSYLKPKISIYLIQIHRSSTFSIGLMTLNIIKDGLLMGSLYYLGHLIQEFTKERGKIIILSISIKFLQDQLLSSNSSKIIHLL